MPRQKVPEDKRQRTAEACVHCKRRKQKCDGQNPCGMCKKRKEHCDYDPSYKHRRQLSVQMPDGPHRFPRGPLTPTQTERQQVDSTSLQPLRRGLSISSSKAPNSPVSLFHSPPEHRPGSDLGGAEHFEPGAWPTHIFRSPINSFRVGESGGQSGSSSIRSHSGSTGTLEVGSIDEKFVIGDEIDITGSHPGRLLQDSNKRLHYIGDPGTLFCLQTVRFLVSEYGHQDSKFVHDRKQYCFLETQIQLPRTVELPSRLPSRRIADVLVESFFLNTRGFVNVLSQEEVARHMDKIYALETQDTSSRCTLYLILAIGQVLATPRPNINDAELLQYLESPFQAEAFYQSAKLLRDPAAFDIGEKGCWAIQALVLTSIYMLTVCRRNAAYGFLGSAVRSAYAVGLHRKEALENLECIDPRLFKGSATLWKTLYILDRFLSAALGRPTAIKDEDCSVEFFPGSQQCRSDETGLDVNAHASYYVGKVMTSIYGRARVSPKRALDQTKAHLQFWLGRLNTQLLPPPDLDAYPEDPSRGLALLHSWLLHHFTVHLVGRKFFFWAILQWHYHRGPDITTYVPPGSDIDCLTRDCVDASYKTIRLIQRVKVTGYLPRCDPFVNHFLFVASVLIMTNEMFNVKPCPQYEQMIEQAVEITDYCRQKDPQADRWYFIMTTFREVVAKEKFRRRKWRPCVT